MKLKLQKREPHEETQNHTRKKDSQGWQERVGPLLQIIKNRGIGDLKKTTLRRQQGVVNTKPFSKAGRFSDVLFGEVPAFLILKDQRGARPRKSRLAV